MSGCTCDIDDNCVCSNDDERMLCDHWHMPAPRIITPRARSNYLNDLRDQGEGRIREQVGTSKDRLSDAAKRTTQSVSEDLIRRGRGSPMDDPSEGVGGGHPRQGGVKLR